MHKQHHLKKKKKKEIKKIEVWKWYLQDIVESQKEICIIFCFRFLKKDNHLRIKKSH